jgi:hypothetical protein
MFINVSVFHGPDEGAMGGSALLTSALLAAEEGAIGRIGPCAPTAASSGISAGPVALGNTTSETR